jgi:hypothetical protein
MATPIGYGDTEANKAARDNVSAKARRVAIKGCSGGLFVDIQIAVACRFETTILADEITAAWVAEGGAGRASRI